MVRHVGRLARRGTLHRQGAHYPGPQSRTALARTLRLSTGSLTRLTKPMVDAGLLVEGDVVHDPVNGRPTRPLDVAAGEHVSSASS